MMVLTGFLKSFMYIAQQSSDIQKLHKLAFFSLLLELKLMPMQLSWVKRIQMFHILKDTYINQNFLYKTKFGRWGGNILNINLFLKMRDRTLCNVFL